MRPVKWQRNVIFKAVAEGGLDVTECTFDYDDLGGRITHVPSQSYFLLEGDPGHYFSTAVVGENPPLRVDAYTWPTVEERVQRWAREVKDDVDTPDLWADLQRQREMLTRTQDEDVENTPFNADERAEIAERLRQILEYLKDSFALSAAQMMSLEARLNYVDAAAGRIGRKDWALLFAGTMLEVIVTNLLPRVSCFGGPEDGLPRPGAPLSSTAAASALRSNEVASSWMRRSVSLI